MTGFVDIAEIIGGKHNGEDVKIRGWLYNSRSSGSIVFLQIRDGTGVLQCTVNKKNVDEATFNNLEKLPQESTLELKGKVQWTREPQVATSSPPIIWAQSTRRSQITP